MALFGIITLPYTGKHLLAHLTMQPTYAIHFLRGITCKGAHAESLALVIGIHTAHADELIPRDTQQLRITAHILAKETFVEIVVSCRYGSVNSIERRGTHQLQSLGETLTLTYEIYQALNVAQGSMTLITVIHILLDAKLLQHQHTADTEQNLLLEAVFPITSVECMSDGAVEL